jgi:hypothetical protein
MEFFYPEIKEYPIKPFIKWSETVQEKVFNGKDNKVFIFCIHRITNVFNDEWEIKADTFFLVKDGKFYFLKEETTNWEQEVEIYRTQEFNFETEEVTLCYSIKNFESFKKVVIPKSQWKPFEFILEVTEIPKGEQSEEIRKLFIGEKFPINLNSNLRRIALRKDECILIPEDDVIKVLLASGKIDLIRSLPEQGFYVHFNHGCYKVH